MTVKAVLFIDANQYLDLYRMVRGKKLLAALEEQKDHIFVTSQVVDEVSRNKVRVAAGFLADAIKKMELNAMTVPDHMLSTGDDRVQGLGKRLQEIRDEVTKVRDDLRNLTQDLLEHVAQSTDEVSRALSPIFSKAAAPNAEELKRAKERKLRGNPPGKHNDPLGDELNWEQILAKCKDKRSIWIITKDSDYASKHEGKMFLNALLYQELALLYRGQPEVFCFDNIAEGLKHFSETTLVKAKELPTPHEAEQIKREQESLPPLDWSVRDALSLAVPNVAMNWAVLSKAIAGLGPNEAAASQFAGALAGLGPNEAAASQFAGALAGLKLNEAAASQLADALAGPKLNEAAASQLAAGLAGRYASDKENPTPSETGDKEDGS